MKEKKVVQVCNLSKEINNKLIIDDVNLTCNEGNIYGIIGRNGSGKTMLFKAICGLIKPTKGEIYIFDNKIHKGELAQNTGLIIENPGFLPQYSAFKNLKMLSSINNTIDDNDINEAILMVGLDPKDKKSVKKFSLGMKQRLGIAQAIMEKPKLLILDEPMNALDEDGIKLMRKLLLELKKQSITILIASHNKEDIDILCDYVYTMVDGKLLN